MPLNKRPTILAASVRFALSGSAWAADNAAFAIIMWERYGYDCY